MNDRGKAKEQLVNELVEMRQRIAELEASEAEHIQTEYALRESEERYRRIIETANEGIWILDTENNTILANNRMAEMLGCTVSEMAGKPLCAFMDEEWQSIADSYAECHRQDTRRQHGFKFCRKDGGELWTIVSTNPTFDREGRYTGTLRMITDITERKRTEEALRRHSLELALLYQASQMFTSTLDLSQVLVTILEEVRHLLDVAACSVWLIDPETDELVCRQATGPQSEQVRSWRLAPGEGIAGYVAHSGESLIVPDTRADRRHFTEVDRQIGLALRSILTVPLRVKSGVIGVLQAVDTDVGRFDRADLTLVESLATTAAIAIENAQLYEQAQRDAETKSRLLREVNHRVKNNLSAIVGLLYAAQRRAGVEERAIYQPMIQDLVSRVQGLATVHSLLSASEWAPLLLSKLAAQVIRSSLQTLPHGKCVSTKMTPSPVRVTPDQAHNLALLINELATNTVKHALQERDKAHITVHIKLDDDTILFEFRDDGPGYPEEVLELECYGVGFDLVQNVVHKNLCGELSLHNDHGALAVIRFKAKV